MKEMNDPVMTNVLLETENMLARGKMDLPLNLCFAAIREDDLLLHQLLKRGLDPNESDNNGRTPLVSEVSHFSVHNIYRPELVESTTLIFSCMETAYSSI